MSQSKAIRIPVQPISGAEPLMCSENVQKRIRAMGGSAVFGWIVAHDTFNDVKQNHVVWEDSTGQLWDVTPVFESVQGEFAIVNWPDFTEFERDDGFVGD